MIVPVRCFTCGKVLADKWEEYAKRVQAQQQKRPAIPSGLEPERAKHDGDGDGVPRGKIMDDLGITRMCCRRHMLGTVDLMDAI